MDVSSGHVKIESSCAAAKARLKVFALNILRKAGSQIKPTCLIRPIKGCSFFSLL